MGQIEWKPEFSIGNALVDQEHELLIDQINQLYKQLRMPLDMVSIESMLGDIQADISSHFVLEELLMQEAGYAEFESHRQDHERLLDQINDLVFHFAADPETGVEMLTDQMSDWFSHHFRTFDARLHNQLGE